MVNDNLIEEIEKTYFAFFRRRDEHARPCPGDQPGGHARRGPRHHHPREPDDDRHAGDAAPEPTGVAVVPERHARVHTDRLGHQATCAEDREQRCGGRCRTLHRCV